MGLFDMLLRREQAESVTASNGATQRAREAAAPIRAMSVADIDAGSQPRLAGTLGSSSGRSPAARLERRMVQAQPARAASMPRPLPELASQRASERATEVRPDDFRDTEVRPETLAHFHQLPSYQALLTVGAEAVYQLPAALHEKLIALDCGARQACLVRAAMPASDQLALDATAKAVKGALRARGYGVVADLVAEPHLLKEILRNAGASGKGAPKGGPMQLFERWIALAVPTGATDLHIEVRRNVGIVRIRVDGRIEPLPDGQGGRYSRKEVVDAIAAGYNSTRVVYDESQGV